MAYVNKPVPGADQFFPLSEPAIGTAYPQSVYPQNAELPILFESITIRGVTFKNRIFVAPMAQYSSDNGHATDWHLVHLGGLATRGAGAICVEATAVLPEGRVSPNDAGLWADSQIAPLKRIVDFVHAHDTMIGIQLGHGGRKASTLGSWVYADIAKTFRAPTYVASFEEGGWPDRVFGASAIPFSDQYPMPKEINEDKMQRVEDAFVQAVQRCKQVGFDFIEIHGAHGYLIHGFLSPLSNARTDQYGGSLENRMRWPLRSAAKIRAAWDKPLFYRISATDWAEGPEQDAAGEWKYWGVEQSKIFAGELEKLGVDLIDCSSGGMWHEQKIPVGPGYQVPFAEALKKAHPELLIGAVGMINEPEQAESYLRDGKADVILLARELMRNPHWPIYAAQKLGVAVKPANQYERGWIEMLTPARVGETSRE